MGLLKKVLGAALSEVARSPEARHVARSLNNGGRVSRALRRGDVAGTVEAVGESLLDAVDGAREIERERGGR